MRNEAKESNSFQVHTSVLIQICFVQDFGDSDLLLPCGRVHFEVSSDEELTSHACD